MAGLPLAVDELVDQFLLYKRHRNSSSESTIKTYKSALGFYLEFIGSCTLNDLSIKQVDDYAMYLLKQNLKPKTYRNRLTVVRSFFKFLYVKDYIDINPKGIELPKEERTEANFLTDEEQHELVAACITLRERALILFLLRSGVRVSELINARTDDLYKKSFVVQNGKGGKPRVTFITDDAAYAIKAYHKTLHPQTYLFPTPTGLKMSRQRIGVIISDIANRTSITKKITPHTLRHTYATNLLRRGARVEDVRPLMGHANIKTTLIYMHFTDDYLHKQYEKVMNTPPTY